MISMLLEQIRTGSPLEQAESWIRQEHYKEQMLKIDRLSGEPLEMDRCYINLALVKTRQPEPAKNPEASTPSPFTLNERLRVQTPPDDLRVELLDLFEPRKRKEKPPRRILIRGRAGVGKTTLCKKIVYEFVHRGMWQSLFKRLVWVRLRNLQGLSESQYNLGGMLKSIFFRQHPNAESLVNAMWHHIVNTSAEDTIFLLDGLDEVTDIIIKTEDRPPHPGNELLRDLINMPNVIITTRPHATFPDGFKAVDLELDTIGFTPDQVHQYIEAAVPNSKDAIEAYLQKNRVMQNLVRIPIQLDALCFTWQDSSTFWHGTDTDVIPETMTAVYEAMAKKLRKKDNNRLSKAVQVGSNEHDDLEYLAFSGLCGNIIEFQQRQRRKLHLHMLKERQRQAKDLYKQTFRVTPDEDDTFARLFQLSFLRTSSTSDETNSPNSQSFHFIHLTFQEYFAAKHFVAAWNHDQTIRYTELDGGPANMRQIREVSCYEFLQKHKYNPQYNIMLRFVAGLLDAEGDSHITRFFQALQREPIDLLGPTHQRLIIHCAAELVYSNDLRTSLESQLSQWLEFECKIRSTSRFTTETELSERVLILVLKRASEKVKLTILSALGKRQNLSLHMMEFVAYWLQRQNASQQLRIGALRMLAQACQCLPTQILNYVIIWMDDEDWETRYAAGRLLRYQKTWPEEVLRAVMAQIESPDAETKERAADLLEGKSQLPENILRTLVSWLKGRDDSLKFRALTVFRGQSELPGDITHAVAAHFCDQNKVTQLLVFRVLNTQPRLAENMLQNMVMWLENMVLWLQNRDDDLENEPGFGARRRRSFHLDLHELKLSNSLLQTILLRLKSPDRNIRARAMRLLERNRYYETFLSAQFRADFMRVMISWVGIHDRALRKFALEALSCDVNLPEDAVNIVVAHTLELDKKLRQIACRVLQHQSGFHARVSSVLLSWLRNEDRAVRRTALEVLNCERPLLGSVLEAVLAQLEEPDGSIRVSALSTLSNLWHQTSISSKILPAVAEKLYDNDGAVVEAALNNIRLYSTRHTLPSDVVRDVVAQLSHQDTAVRRTALEILRRVGLRDAENRNEQTFSDEIIHAIATQLEHQNRDVRSEALRALGAFGSRHAFPENILEAIVALIEDDSTKYNALEALANQQASPECDWQEKAVILFQDTSESRGYRIAAIRAIMGDKDLPERILSALVSLLSNEDTVIRIAAEDVLKSQTRLPVEHAEALWEKFKHADADLRFKLDALAILRAHPNLPESILRGTMPWIQAKQWGVRHSGVDLLGTDPMLPLDPLQSITKLLDDDNPPVRLAVLTALRGQKALPGAILSPENLYPVWVKRSFEEHSYCFIEDGKIQVELPEGFGKVFLEGDVDTFRAEICDRQKELGMPTLFDHNNR